MTDDAQDEYLTLKQVAEITGISVRRLQQMVKGYWSIKPRYGERKWYDPVVPAKMAGHTYLIHRDDIKLVVGRRRPGGPKGQDPRARWRSEE